MTTTVGRLAADLDAIGATRTVLVLVGPALRGAARSLAPLRPAVRAHVPPPVPVGVDRGAAGVSAHAVTREPDLAPEVAARTKGLRAGWTTGTCASAAAKAAAVGLVGGTAPAQVEVAPAFGAAGELPGRERAPEPVRRREGRGRRSRLHRRRPGDGRGGLGDGRRAFDGAASGARRRHDHEARHRAGGRRAGDQPGPAAG